MLKIHEFSKKTGISKRMLRYLEDQGLLVPQRQDNDYRVYQEHHLEEVRWIQFWQRLGFSLLQIKTLKNLDPNELETRLEALLDKKKKELSDHSTQLGTIRDVIQKIRKLDNAKEDLDLRKEFSQIESWTNRVRDDFYTDVVRPELIVYGKYPEIETLFDTLLEGLAAGGYKITAKDFNIMRMGPACRDMPAGEALVWDRPSDYFTFSCLIPETVLEDDFAEDFEEKFYACFQNSLDKTFYPRELRSVRRLFQGPDILLFCADNEVVIRLRMNLEHRGLTHEISLYIPFQFVHGARQGTSKESSALGRQLHASVLQLSDEQIRKKTKEISNQQYLLTTLLVDSETRYKMFRVLSSEAKKTVMDDLRKMVDQISDSWS